MPPDKLRIAIFSDSALPILNGVSVSIDALITELRHQGHSVHLFTARHPNFNDPDPNTHRFRAIETERERQGKEGWSGFLETDDRWQEGYVERRKGALMRYFAGP